MASCDIGQFFTLTCVRHGETEANQIGLIQGQGVDSPLNKSGKRQSEKIGNALSEEDFTIVYSSDLKRSKETCEIILSKSKSRNSSIIYDKRLRERCFGVMEGRYYHELRNFAFPSDDVEESDLPDGAESIKDVESRAAEFFTDMFHHIYSSTKTGKGKLNILLVSHGGFLACLFNCFDQLHNCKFPAGVEPGEISVNTCRSVFRVLFKDNALNQEKSLPKFEMKCLTLNDYSHLY